MSKKYKIELTREQVKKVVDCKEFEDKIIEDYCKKQKHLFKPDSINKYVKNKIIKGLE